MSSNSALDFCKSWPWVDPAEHVVIESRESKVSGCDSGPISPLCAIGYQNWHALTMPRST